MWYFRVFLLSIGFFFTILTMAFGQTDSLAADFTREILIAISEEEYGMDDLLVNGIRYQPEKIGSEGSPYFDWNVSAASGLFIKGQLFPDVDLLYDITTDQLILDKNLEHGYKLQVVLDPIAIDSFYLGNHFFINLPVKEKNTAIKGYYEKIYSGRELFLKKYSKDYIKIYDKSNRGKFSPQRQVCYIYSHGSLFRVNSKMAFLDFYDAKKKEIRAFMKRNKIRYGSATNEELFRLLTFCHAQEE
jgi:hypothetical protein